MELRLFGGPDVVVDGRCAPLPEAGRRLVVLLALRGGRVDRRELSATLWPDGDDLRAGGNLRSTLWRLRAAELDLVEATPGWLRLQPGTLLDTTRQSAWAVRLIGGHALEEDLAEGIWRTITVDLLPDWSDEWVVFERRRLRQRYLHGLDALARTLLSAGRTAAAVQAAAAALRADPLRGSAHRTLLEAYLARGDELGAARTRTTLTRLARVGVTLR